MIATLIALSFPLTYLVGFLYTPALYVKADRNRVVGRRYQMVDTVGDLDPVGMFVMCLFWPIFWIGWALLFIAKREISKGARRGL